MPSLRYFNSLNKFYLMSNSSNFKVIVALKAAKDQKITSVRCAI